MNKYQEVSLSETEFKKARELDDGEFENIRKEYLKRMVVYPLIWFFIAAAIFVLWLVGEIQKLYVFSDVINYTIMFLVAITLAIAVYQFSRCILSLAIISKINKRDFYWHAGHITRRKRLWIAFGMDHYYIVDDEYSSRVCFDPFYFEGTEVYFLYFPGFMRGSYLGGIVVRKKE